MSSQQGEDEERAWHDAEFAERHTEASPCQHHTLHTHARARTHTSAHSALSLHKPRICTGIMCQSAHFLGKMAV